MKRKADSLLFVLTDRCHRSKSPEMWQRTIFGVYLIKFRNAREFI